MTIDSECINDYDRKELSGETGANPVRARRRKAQICCADLTGSHISGQAIGEYPRRLASIVLSRNIRTVQPLIMITASASLQGK